MRQDPRALRADGSSVHTLVQFAHAMMVQTIQRRSPVLVLIAGEGGHRRCIVELVAILGRTVQRRRIAAQPPEITQEFTVGLLDAAQEDRLEHHDGERNDEHRHANADHHPAIDGEVLRDRDEVGSLPAAFFLPVGAIDDEIRIHALAARLGLDVVGAAGNFRDFDLIDVAGQEAGAARCSYAESSADFLQGQRRAAGRDAVDIQRELAGTRRERHMMPLAQSEIGCLRNRHRCAAERCAGVEFRAL